jgi:phytoene desaturase
LQRVFSFQSMYAGLAPHEALALYGVITYMDTVNGVFIPRGGMHALPRALASAAETVGVDFLYNTRVERIVLAEEPRAPYEGSGSGAVR